MERVLPFSVFLVLMTNFVQRTKLVYRPSVRNETLDPDPEGSV